MRATLSNRARLVSLIDGFQRSLWRGLLRGLRRNELAVGTWSLSESLGCPPLGGNREWVSNRPRFLHPLGIEI